MKHFIRTYYKLFIKLSVILLGILEVTYSCKKDDGPDNNNNDTTIVAMYGVQAAEYLVIENNPEDNHEVLNK